MSQNALALPLVGVYSGTQAATYMNNALDTLATKQSGSSAPTGPALGWNWLDTSVANQATWKVYDGTSWVSVGTIDETNHRWVPVVGGGTATVPSASTTDLWDATNNKNHSANVIISGVVTITGLGSTVAVGALVFITFSGVLTLTHDATNLVLPTGANITTAVGDTCIAICKASGQYRILAYQKADGSPLLTSGTIGGSFAFTGVISPSALAAQADDYAPTGNATATVWRLSTSASANRVITGIAGGSSGRILILQNVNSAGAGNITLAAQNTSSAAGNRLAAPADILVRPGEGRTLIYDNTAGRWSLNSQILQAPTVQKFTSGTGATYTPSTGVVRIRVRMVGGGGGGGGAFNNSGTSGTDTSFGSWVAKAGLLGAAGGGGGAGGTGGADGTGTLIARITGGAGATGGSYSTIEASGVGGANLFAGAGTNGANAAGGAAAANTGAGGGGGSSGNFAGGGGGAAEYVEFFVSNPAATTYTVGVKGTGGAAGGTAGGNGADGVIVIEELYS